MSIQNQSIYVGTITNAGSFIRPSRAPDPPLTFIEALRKKYIGDGAEGFSTQRPIEWGGKVVEEIGFDKVRQKLRLLKELKVVLVDGLQVAKEDPTDLITVTCPSTAYNLSLVHIYLTITHRY